VKEGQVEQTFRFASRLAVEMVLLSIFASSQQHAGMQVAKAGIVSGSVFAITKGGDLKPARLAHVYLLYVHRSVSFANAHPDDDNSAAMSWIDNHNKAMEQYDKELSAEGMNWSDAVMCRKRLLTYHEALSQTLEWMKGNQKSWQMLAVDADENGAFRIAVPHPGDYIVLATGQAGFNDGFWVTDLLNTAAVKPGQTTNVKLSSPAEACLNVETE
jgi:hypothetical protein